MSLKDLECFASMDWGYNAYGCFLWWVCLTDGHYHIAKEWKFKGMTAPVVAKEFKATTQRLGVNRLRYVVADPACWQKDGTGRGESISETLSRLRLPMKKGDNNRVLGWQRIHELLGVAPDGRPWLTVDPSCTYLRRTIPGSMSDKADPDDVDTKGDDHGVDCLRYGAMSRPSPTRVQRYHPLVKGSAGALFKDAREAAARESYATL